MSTQLAQKKNMNKKASGHDSCPMWRTRDLSTLVGSISLVVRFPAFAAFAAGFRIRFFVCESALVTTSTGAFGVMFAGNRRAENTVRGRRWHPFSPQPSCR